MNLPPTAKNDARILIGILASNHKEKTLACLESLDSSIYDEGFDVFLLDNGSNEGIAEEARRFDFVTAETSSQNLGAAGGRNVILRHFLEEGDWPYVLLIDNDIVVRPDTLDVVVRTAENMKAQGCRLGALSIPIVYRDEPDTCWSTGGGMFDWDQAWIKDGRQGSKLGDDAVEPRRVDTMPTAFMLATRDAARDAGMFIEDYFIYIEDSDWCLHMTRAGHELWATTGTHAVHDVSSSLGKCTPRFYFLRTRNRLWFFTAYSNCSKRKVRWRVGKDVFWNSCYPELRSGHWAEAVAVITGYFSGLFLPGSLTGSRRTASAPSVRQPATQVSVKDRG